MSGIDYRVGDADTRPWGRWAVLAVGSGYVVKEIEVNSGHILSLQSHEHRTEHWVILEGDAEVTLNEDKMRLAADDTVLIPVGARHRIANVGEGPMRFIEIQTGAVLSEDDIVRYEDSYGRAAG